MNLKSLSNVVVAARSSNAVAARRVVAVVLTVLMLLPVAASAQQASSTMGPQFMSGTPGTYAIRNARIVTVSGADIENGTVVIRDGKIAAVGANVQVPAGALEVDARGLSVYPGMIDLGTSIGLIEIPQGANPTVDVAEVGDMNPNAQAFYGINPHSAHVAVTRVNGITSVLSAPTGGIISGQAAFINLLGSSPQEMAVVQTAALVVNYPRAAGGGGFGGFFQQAQQNPTEAAAARDRQVEQLRKMLRDAEAYGRAMDASERDRNLPRPDADVLLASLVPYVRGERPVLFRADREAEMRAAVRFSEEMKLKPIILGGNDAWKIASFLKEKNVPVILNGLFDLPSREDDYYDVMYESAAKLQQAGVRFALSTGDQGAEVRDLPYRAGMAAAFGLSRADALKSVTLYPAQIMGLGDRLGSIETGKIANLVVTDGDILEARTHIRHLFINGRQVPLNSRHTELYEQFKNRK
ncbi:MAG TPA: amidohydrolase family protein [Pyrinomonadaceae bacterium]|nr:amidohydrolase family protein [Pyrinomonadaceae bacterium]